MKSERILQLLAKKMGQAASDKEMAELQKLLQQNPEYSFLIELLQSFEIEKLHKEPALKEDDLMQESWLMLERELDELPASGRVQEIKKSRLRKPLPSWMRVAAIWIGILLLAGFYFFKSNSPKEDSLKKVTGIVNQVSVPFGTPEKKVLPDGTEAWLNAGSRIRYADNFIQKNRDVYLDGEAYFSVKHDADHPFIVHVGNVTIRALGTKFNVHAYQNESKIEATLISGKILVKIDGKPDQDIILIPNEKLTVINEEFSLPNKKNEPRKEVGFQVQEVAPMPSVTELPEVAWLQDKLAFQNESFEELAKRMERRYDVHIVFKDSRLGNERLSGIFKNENIQKALNLLQMTTPFRYEFKQDSVYLKR
jgi:ferric-dicitrate binding protein FerR (iron transport regulator)